MNTKEQATQPRLAAGIRLPLSVTWPEPFQLPTPPPGVQWHDSGWTADMLPRGFRPLYVGEKICKDDEYFAWNEGPWKKAQDCQAGDRSGDHIENGDVKYRTTRPLTFTHLGKTWTWHKAGDPMPCDGERSVNYLMRDLGAATTKFAKDLRWSPATKSECAEADIIGWRYAETEPATKTVDLGPEDVPPGSAVRDQGSSCWWSALNVDSYGITFCDEVRGRWSWQQLRAAYEINRSSPLTGKWNPDAWEPCHKQIPA